MAAVARLVPAYWSYVLGEGEEFLTRPPVDQQECGDALAAVRGLSEDDIRELPCRVTADCIRSCSVQGLNATRWDVESLSADHLRQPRLSQLLRAFRRTVRAIHSWVACVSLKIVLTDFSKAGRRAQLEFFVELYSGYLRDSAQLVSLGVTNLSQLLIPLAFEHMGNHTNDQQFHRWMKHMGRLRNMLDTVLRGRQQDILYASRQIANYKVVEDKTSPRNYKIRRPLLSTELFAYHEDLLSFRDDFGALCEKQQPQAAQMFGLADALYAFYRRNWFFGIKLADKNDTIDEEWRLEDQSSALVSVDTDCLQLLADALDRPTCPLEDLPPETIEKRQQCREQLWDDMVRRSPHIPVTSYLAYTQRASVHLCLLAWMAANSRSICQDVPFSILQSVHDARCYFDSPDDSSCVESKATDAICSVSRAILLFKCSAFSSFKPPKTCAVYFYTTGQYSDTVNITWKERPYKVHGKPTKIALNYKSSLTSATLKYRDFKVDSLKPLEHSFIGVNILFRLFTGGVYVYLPQLRNLPGKILFSFQITGVVQILSSEVVYRLTGFPSISTAVLIDSGLTLFSCLWLNSFCYQMYACVRHLRLPNDLTPAEASKEFRRQALYVLVPWSVVCATCTALEKSSKYYLIHSRIIFLVAISLSVAFNTVCLVLVGYMYFRAKNSMTQLKVYSKDKFASKKQLVFMTVKTIILSGIGIIIRIGFHQTQGIAQFVYWVHLTTMAQGPVLFVFFICNETTLPVFRDRILGWSNPGVVSPGEELCSAAERNLERRSHLSPAAETSL